MNRILFAAALLIFGGVVTPLLAITPDNPGPAAVQLTVNSSQDVRSISPYIYGMNFFANSSLTNPVTLDRLGGNRWSGYNWETNASNAGSDWFHSSDTYLVGGAPNTPPGEAVRPALMDAAANGRGLVVTVPMAGYVAADTAGTVTEAQAAPSTRWHSVVAKKATQYPGVPLSLAPNESDDYVFTDEFVNWVEQTKSPGQQVFYSLDNEPGLWDSTHARLHPASPTFAEMRGKTLAHAAAIKDGNPQAIVFGGVGYGWSDFTTLQDAADRTTSPAHPGGNQTGELDFYEYLLKEVRTAEIAQGRTLMDAIDLHWYPEAQGGGVRITENNNSAAVVAARVQAPRSLWDPSYVETSWISQWSTWSGTPGNPGAVTLLPRVQRDIDDFKPGTKIAITEYNYGGTNHISGAIAQADVLGIFGRVGVFAANFWSLYGDDNSKFVEGAFKMFLDYDGEGGQFGDTSVDSASSNIAQASIHASVDSSDPNRMVVVAINRTGSAVTTGIAVTHDRVFDHAEVFQLTSNVGGDNYQITQAGDIELDLVNAFQYMLPAWSVSTLVLVSDGLPGDFNRDGTVDAADYLVWRKLEGGTGNLAADANEDNVIDDEDLALWRANLGVSESGGGSGANVPEPGCAMTFVVCLSLMIRKR
jgi:hypothetical protein